MGEGVMFFILHSRSIIVITFIFSYTDFPFIFFFLSLILSFQVFLTLSLKYFIFFFFLSFLISFLCCCSFFIHSSFIPHIISFFFLFFYFFLFPFVSFLSFWIVEASLSIVPIPRCGEVATPFPGLLRFTLDPYFIMLSVRQRCIKYHFLSLWYGSTWDWTQATRAYGEQSNLHEYIYLYIYIYIYIYGGGESERDVKLMNVEIRKWESFPF